MRSQCHIHMCNGVAGCVAPFCDGCREGFARFLVAIHSRESNSQTKTRPAGETPRLLIKDDCFVELPHLAIQSSQSWLAICHKCRVELQCTFTGCDRFVIQAEVTIELTSKVVYPQRRRIDFRRAPQVGQRLVAV